MRVGGAARPARRRRDALFGRVADADRLRDEDLVPSRALPEPARFRNGATAARRLRSRLPAFRRLPRRSAGWVTHAVALQHVQPEHERIGSCVGILGERGLCAGDMTSTTPGWAFAASTSRTVTRPRAMLLTASDGVEHAGGVVIRGVAGASR